MRKSLDIIVIEDERILAETISSMVEELGHRVVGRANSIGLAKDLIQRGGFDLAILDINLKTGNEGIEIGQILFEYKIPFFFLTSYTDGKTIQQAKAVNPGAYVVKPFTEQDLYVAIEMSAVETEESTVPSVSVRKGNAYARVKVSDIHYLKAENIYTELHTKDKKWLKRSSLKDLMDELHGSTFIQTHRSYAVNLEHIIGWSSKTIHVNGTEIPVSRRLWDDIKSQIEARYK